MLLLSSAWCLTLALLEEAMAVSSSVGKAGEFNVYCDGKPAEDFEWRLRHGTLSCMLELPDVK